MANISRFFFSRFTSIYLEKFTEKNTFLAGFIVGETNLFYPFGYSRESSQNISTLSSGYVALKAKYPYTFVHCVWKPEAIGGGSNRKTGFHLY